MTNRSLEIVPGGTSNLADDAYHRIHRDIISCRLLPDSTVTEPMLMETYRIGKNSCRSALARLAHDNLIISRPRKGYRISPILLQDVEEIFTMRAELEPLAARLAVGKVNIESLKQLEAACRQRHKVTLPERIGIFMDANKLFHLEIAKASGNQRLFLTLSRLMNEMSRLVALGYNVQGTQPEIKHDHNAMIEAFIKEDSDKVESITKQHIHTFQKMTYEHLYSTLKSSKTILPLIDRRIFG
ncbi:GntR family transcriptional regulator [Billgrantia endophytica]|uniref:GntR family transcriptional regulator n=2 Tax=Billgrantia endophytica TaxID=2033802 RepID=A0A2N7U759_9GAMM|nr:GntR family transcriptional regulator [Halomonas endophytica]